MLYSYVALTVSIVTYVFQVELGKPSRLGSLQHGQPVHSSLGVGPGLVHASQQARQCCGGVGAGCQLLRAARRDAVHQALQL